MTTNLERNIRWCLAVLRENGFIEISFVARLKFGADRWSKEINKKTTTETEFIETLIQQNEPQFFEGFDRDSARFRTVCRWFFRSTEATGLEYTHDERILFALRVADVKHALGENAKTAYSQKRKRKST